MVETNVDVVKRKGEGSVSSSEMLELEAIGEEGNEKGGEKEL